VHSQLLTDKNVLVLEDQLLIAMEVEHSLLQLGAKSVVIACTTDEALELMQETKPDLAVLDINLGPSTTSFPVAETLRSNGTPWVFATGYGNEINIPPPLKTAALIRKPYTTEMLAKALNQTLAGVS
jgi:CheY-like chemotaxis protein